MPAEAPGVFPKAFFILSVGFCCVLAGQIAGKEVMEPVGTGLCCAVNRCHGLCLILPQLPAGFGDHFHCFAKHLKDADPLYSPEYGV